MPAPAPAPAPAPVPIPALSRARAIAPAIVVALAFFVALVAACGRPSDEAPFGEEPFADASDASAERGWLWEVTGEESAWEAVKGVGALATLRMTQPRLQLEPDAPIDHLGASPYGINTFLQLEADPQVVRRSLALLRDAGIHWARQQFPWEDIEIHDRGDFEDRRNEPARSAWDKYDRLVQLAGEYGIQLLVRLDDPPDWAYAPDEPRGHRGPPTDTADYANFVAAVVQRYCGKVRYYQLWNEPNIYPEWGERDVDPVGYAAFLHQAAVAARAACPDVVVVSAAMAQTTEVGGRNMDDLAYLAALYEAGWQADFDVLAVQGFGLWTGPTDRRVSPDRANFNRLLLARDLMVRSGDAEKAMWITEMGWDSPPEDMDAPFGRVTEAIRAEYTVRAYQRMAAEWPFVGVGFVWHFRRPDREWHTRPEGWFRLVEPDWDETPAFAALRDLALQPPTLDRGRHEVDAVALERNGAWRTVPPEGQGPARHAIGSKGAEISARFEGTGVTLRLVETPAAAAAPALGSTGAPSGTLGAGTTTTAPTDTLSAGEMAATAPAVAPAAAPASSALTGMLGVTGTTTAAPTGTLAAAVPATTTLFVVVDGTSQAVVLPPGAAEWAADDLEPGEHSLIVRVDGGELALDEVVVRAPDPPDPLAPLYRAAAAVLGLLVLGLRAVVLRRRRRVAATGAEPEAVGPPSGA